MSSSETSSSVLPTNLTLPPPSNPTHQIAPSPSLQEGFDGSNFIVWKARLLPFLMASRLLPILEGTVTAPPPTLTSASGTETPNPAFTDRVIRDQTALSWILNTSTNSIVTQILDLRSSTEAWTYLRKSYAAKSSAHASSLRQQLHTITKGDRSITGFFHEVKSLLD